MLNNVIGFDIGMAAIYDQLYVFMHNHVDIADTLLIHRAAATTILASSGGGVTGITIRFVSLSSTPVVIYIVVSVTFVN